MKFVSKTDVLKLYGNDEMICRFEGNGQLWFGSSQPQSHPSFYVCLKVDHSAICDQYYESFGAQNKNAMKPTFTLEQLLTKFDSSCIDVTCEVWKFNFLERAFSEPRNKFKKSPSLCYSKPYLVK